MKQTTGPVADTYILATLLTPMATHRARLPGSATCSIQSGWGHELLSFYSASVTFTYAFAASYALEAVRIFVWDYAHFAFDFA